MKLSPAILAVGMSLIMAPAALGHSSGITYDGSGRSHEAVSFELLTHRTGGRIGRVLENVVIVTRVRCTQNGKAQRPSLGAFQYPHAVRLARGGRFAARITAGVTRGKLSGRVAGGHVNVAYHARSSVTIPSLFGGGPIHSACRSVMRATAHRDHRLAVRDGLWRGRASDGERVLFNVYAGGRLVLGVTGGPQPDPGKDPFTFGTWLTSCSGAFCESAGDSRCAYQTDGTSAFITPGGVAETARFKGSSDPYYTIEFTSPVRARGIWRPKQPSSSDGQSCVESWSATVSSTRRG